MTLPGTEGALRLSVALGLLLVMALWELAAPRRRAGGLVGARGLAGLALGGPSTRL